jgi:predicted permease
MNALWSDFRYAARSLRQSRGVSVTAMLALALGIGANTALFSVVDAVLLRPLPYPEPDRMVQLLLSTSQGAFPILSVPEYASFRDQSSVFEDAAAFDMGGPGISLTGGDRPEQVNGLHVSADYFRLYGARVAIGRTFTADEDRPGGGRAVVISDGLWRRRYGADPSLVGKTISLGGDAYTLAGVLAPDFTPDQPADLFLPLQADLHSTSQAHYIAGAARLKAGTSLEQTNAQLKLATQDFRRRFPGFDGVTLSAAPMARFAVRDVRQALSILLGAVGFVLLIGCANVANLQLARAAGRSREIAIRCAMGASRSKIMRLLLAESLLLAAAGGTLGLLGGRLGVTSLLAAYPGSLPRIGQQGVTLDWRVFAFTAVLSILTGLLFGLMPAWRASREDLSAMINQGGVRSGAGRWEGRMRSTLVAAEMALTLLLLVGAGLLLRTFAALRTVAPGFDTTNILTMEMSLTGDRFQKTAALEAMVRNVERRIQRLVGVEAVASSWRLPLESAFHGSLVIEGRPVKGGEVHGLALMRPVSQSYFEVFRIPLVRGRVFGDHDTGTSSGVVIISQALAKQHWPNADPVGKRIVTDRPREIVGVVGDVRDVSLDRDPEPMMYEPQSQVTDNMSALNAQILPLTWSVRTKAAPFSIRAVLEQELRAASGGLPVGRVRSIQQVVSESTARSDFNTLLMAIFAGFALLLAAVGIYGVMRCSVETRTQEIGVRMALGAAPAQVRNMVVLHGMRMALAGIAIGGVASYGLARVMAGLIYGVKTSDLITFVSAATVLGVVALAAAYLPALRATKVDPMKVLRSQ